MVGLKSWSKPLLDKQQPKYPKLSFLEKVNAIHITLKKMSTQNEERERDRERERQGTLESTSHSSWMLCCGASCCVPIFHVKSDQLYCSNSMPSIWDTYSPRCRIHLFSFQNYACFFGSKHKMPSIHTHESWVFSSSTWDEMNNLSTFDMISRDISTTALEGLMPG